MVVGTVVILYPLVPIGKRRKYRNYKLNFFYGMESHIRKRMKEKREEEEKKDFIFEFVLFSYFCS